MPARPLVALLTLLMALAFPAQAWPPVVSEPDEITMAFTGDILIHMGVTAAAARNGEPYDFRPMFQPVRHLISGADLAICHLEVPLSPDNTGLAGYPRLNAPREVADALAHAGYDGCSTASNHSYDQGVAGVLGTLGVLQEAGLQQAGMADSPEQGWQATFYDLGRLRLAHLSATYWLNGLRMPDDMPWLVQLLEVEELILAAARARGAGADLVVVSMHCCIEYQIMPTAEQIATSHALINSPFVDLVVTHHSHVVGPVEKVGEKFIVHGLGNFLSGQRQMPRLQDGVIAFATARFDGIRWRFTEISVVPTQVAPGTYQVHPVEPGSASYERTMEAINLMGADIGRYRPSPSFASLRALIE